MRTRLYRRTHAASWLAIPLYALSACNTDAPAGPDASGDLLPGRDYIHVRPLDAQDLQRVAGRAIRALAEARFPGNVPNDVAASQTDTREYGAFTHVHLDYNYADIVSHHWASGASFINLQGSMFGAFRRGSMLPVTVSDGCFSIFSSVCTMGDATDDIDCYGPDGAAAAADGRTSGGGPTTQIRMHLRRTITIAGRLAAAAPAVLAMKMITGEMKPGNAVGTSTSSRTTCS
jgi:hypothetical protein